MFKQLYFSTKGRCDRKCYWVFGFLPFFITIVLVGSLDVAFQLYGPLLATIILIGAWPFVVMQIKRWHDVGLTGWLILLGAIPYIGVIFPIGIGFVPGNVGENRFGPAPLKKN